MRVVCDYYPYKLIREQDKNSFPRPGSSQRHRKKSKVTTKAARKVQTNPYDKGRTVTKTSVDTTTTKKISLTQAKMDEWPVRPALPHIQHAKGRSDSLQDVRQHIITIKESGRSNPSPLVQLLDGSLSNISQRLAKVEASTFQFLKKIAPLKIYQDARLILQLIKFGMTQSPT